ncbi:MAG: DUF885 domain-containing protein [Thermoplasmata archaeon]|nr:DUF885 domain-containing protein [Thermoplasmata archaeon]
MDKMFDDLVQEYVDTWVERHPVLGTVLGLHQYDHLLPDGTRDAVLDDIQKDKEFQKRFEEIDENELSPLKRIERKAMLHSFRVSLFNHEEYRQWESNPIGVDVIGASIFRLYARDFAPLEERLASITSRLEKAPRYLIECKTRIIRPVKLWVEIQLESCKRFPVFLDDIVNTASEVLDSSKLEELKQAVKDTKEAILEYERWLTDDLLQKAEEEYRMGEDLFTKAIELKNLGLSVAEVRELGDHYLETYKKKLEEIAEEIEPGAGVEKVREIVKSNHPENFDEVMKEYRESVEKSRTFVREYGMIDMPSGESLSVVETPSYLRHTIPFAAYMMPGRYDSDQEGIYLVTPIEDNPEMMKEHSYPGITNTSVHEGYPGHHLQLVASNMIPSLVPTIVHASEAVEGWAHYCEDWMIEMGFDDTAETRFVQTTDLIWRAARIIIDVDLHTKKITMEEGVDFLVDRVGIERPAALAEVKRYTIHPAYQLCYLIGKHLIMQLRDEVKERMGNDYTDGFFHNTFLESGGIPMYLTRQVFDVKLKEMGL